MKPKTRYPQNQLLFRLARTIIFEQAHSLVENPDRTTADYELDKIRREYGSRLLRAAIQKRGKGPKATWTVRYFTRETRTENLF